MVLKRDATTAKGQVQQCGGCGKVIDKRFKLCYNCRVNGFIVVMDDESDS